MTCLKHTIKPAALQLQVVPQNRAGATHQQAALLALHFRSAAWTPCIPGPTLLAASAIMGAVQTPAAQWDAWFFPRGSARSAATIGGDKTSIRRARLRAAAMVVADDADAAGICVLEERVAPGSRAGGRRLVAMLRVNPYSADATPAPIDPRAISEVVPMPARQASHANPQPDATVDLEALGLIAPRPQTW